MSPRCGAQTTPAGGWCGPSSSTATTRSSSTTRTLNYREVELSIYERAGDLWQLIANQDDAGLPDVGQGTGRGWAADVLVGGGHGWAYGRERPRTAVRLSYKGEPVEVTADADGWWMCIRRTPEGDNDSPIMLD
jgi:hypothetical protein